MIILQGMLKPATDTLKKISQYNSWLKDRLSLQSTSLVKEGLYCYLIKRHSDPSKDYQIITNYLQKNDFSVLHELKLAKEEMLNARIYLRGGNWNQPYNDDITEELIYDPVYLIVFGDPYNRSSRFIARIKSNLREIIDNTDISKIHSSDSTIETFEYLEAIDASLKDSMARRWSSKSYTKSLSISVFLIINKIKSYI